MIKRNGTGDHADVLARAINRNTPTALHCLQSMLAGDAVDYAVIRGRESYRLEVRQVYGVSPSWAAIARMESLGGSLARCIE